MSLQSTDRQDTPTVGVVFTPIPRPHDLAGCSRVTRRQSHADFEIVIADDGSGEETRECIRPRVETGASHPPRLHETSASQMRILKSPIAEPG